MNPSLRTILVAAIFLLVAAWSTPSHAEPGNGAPRKRGFLGVQLESVNDGRVIVGNVIADSPAFKAGLKSGEEILFINGKRVHSSTEAAGLIAGVGVGNSFEMTIMSSGALKKVRVALTEQPAGFAELSPAESSGQPAVGGPSANSAGRENTRAVDRPGTAIESNLADMESNSVEAIINFLQSPNAILNGGTLTRTDSLRPSKIPDGLKQRVLDLANVNVNSGETLIHTLISDDWQNAALTSYEPRTLAVLTTKAIYVNNSWKDREKRGFHIERVSYKELLTKLGGQYNRMGFEDGILEIEGGRRIKSSSEVIRFLHVLSKIAVKAAIETTKSSIVAQNALPDSDLRAIKGFGSVRWDTPRNVAVELLGIKSDSSTKTFNYTNQTPDKILSSWSHYPSIYPGIKLASPLVSIQYVDRSGSVWLHFLDDKLRMVEREVSEDIKKHSLDAIANMLTKYGEARREVCNFTIGSDGGDNLVRFVWETQFGRVIALCDAWYPDNKLSDTINIDDNHLRLSVKWIGSKSVFKAPSEKNRNGSYSEPSKQDEHNPTLRSTLGAFVQVGVELENLNTADSWNFDASSKIELIDETSMEVITSNQAISGPKIECTLSPYSPAENHERYHQNLYFLFDLDLDKLPKNKPSFFRLTVSPTTSPIPIYADFLVVGSRIEPVRTLFSMLKPLTSGVLAELVPANMRLAIRSIAYNSNALISDVTAKSLESAENARAEAYKKESKEREKVKIKSLKDL